MPELLTVEPQPGIDPAPFVWTEPRYLPSEEEIKAECAAIRETWSEHEHRVRAGLIPNFGQLQDSFRSVAKTMTDCRGWTVPVVKIGGGR